MAIQKAIVAILLANTPVTDAVGDRISPSRHAQFEQLPFVTLGVVDYEDLCQTHSGTISNSIARTTITITVYAMTYKECVEISRKIKTALVYYSGSIAGETIKVIVPPENKTEIAETPIDGEETSIYSGSSDYPVLHLDS